MRHGIIVALAALVLSSSSAAAATVNVTVDSQTGPWSQSANPAYYYGAPSPAAPDNLDPVRIAVSGNELVQIKWIGGLTDEFGNTPSVDGRGYASLGLFPSNNPGSTGGHFPGFYTSGPGSAYLGELVGAFSDASGKIVGGPFIIGNGLDTTSPGDAVFLLLGINDDLFSDNVGALQVSVTADSVAAVPEPSTWAMLIIGFAGIGFVALRNRNRSMTPAV
ncbi:PEPxxWA-CTERM sorting domain-containing protein [Bradyrhizobium lablabi]|uniref:PEPxxWA-CTERM sorting domain-containing protein n=1 Tax=Bradyrhizobium lablabi TaxID=722472 RepID=UPI001BAB68EC|nr:PEPxxWA-CTERM sorting domain-containing protein [Bradyrhizobium lablabi]MBR0697753.1 PEPxxWA-CTERM sorting domain-containing protein [Bradyrhizobium lablabi]